jgi:cobalt-zinc-cadmium efflux system outer membrane protein
MLLSCHMSRIFQPAPLSVNRLVLAGMVSTAFLLVMSTVKAADPPPAPAGYRLSLTQVLEQVDRRNPQLLAARSNLSIARAESVTAGAVPNPQFSFTYGLGAVYYTNGNPQLLFGLSQNFELGGKRDARLGLADSQYRLAVLQLDSLRREIRNRARRAYADLAAAEAQARAMDVQIDLLDQLVRIVQKRFEAGATAEAELLQAKLARTQADPQRIVARSRVERARYLLNALLGENPEQLTDLSDTGLFELSVEKTEIAPRADIVFSPLQDFLRRAFQSRVDLKAAVQQAEVGRSLLKLAQAQTVPDLQLTGTYQRFTGDAPPADGLSLGIALNLPIFYNQNGELARAQAILEQAVLQEQAIRAQIRLEVQTAYQDLLAARKTILKYQKELLPSSEDVRGLARRSYEVGKSGLSVVILAQQADQQVRSGYIDAVVAYQNAWADLEQAVGAAIEP